MKKLILATVSAIALFGVAACSDSGKVGADNRHLRGRKACEDRNESFEGWHEGEYERLPSAVK